MGCDCGESYCDCGNMRCGCGGANCCCGPPRGFFTKEEKIEMLEKYKTSLEKEAKGVAEKIKELKKSS